MTNPTVSIIMPNYNGGKWIQGAIKSVINQTFENWELIVIDDCSIDTSLIAAIVWRDNDKRIKLFNMGVNSGNPAIPRNVGMRQARGKYIAFLDVDDRWSPFKLQKQVEVMEKNPETGLSYHDMFIMKNGLRQSYFWSDMARPHQGKCLKKLLWKNFIANSSVMIQRGCIYQDSRLKISHDWDMWLKYTSFDSPIIYMDSILGTLNLNGVTRNVKLRRKESREVVRKWQSSVSLHWYLLCMGRYYLVELYDLVRRK